MSCPSRLGSRSVAKVVDRHGVRRCGVCGELRAIKKRADGDQPDQCRRCWAANPRSWKRCGVCNEPGRIKGRTPEGRPTCARCYDRAAPTGRCDDCGQVRKLRVRGSSGGPRLCAACYRHRRPPRRCDRCGRVREIVARATEQDHVTCAMRALRRLVRDAVGSAVRSSRSLARHATESPTSARLALTDCCRWRSVRNAGSASHAFSRRASGRSAGCAARRPTTRAIRARSAASTARRRGAARSERLRRCMSRHLGSRAVCESAGSCVAPRPLIQQWCCVPCAGVAPHHVCELCGGEDERVPEGSARDAG